MSNKPNEISNYKLDHSFHKVHKEKVGVSDFGLDNTDRLIGDGFGLYSSAGLKPKIGPIKSEFFRIGFGVRGSVHIHCGLESFRFSPGSIAFTFPGQIFSMQDKSIDFFAYYTLFTENFVDDSVSLKKVRNQFPFLNYSGTQCFALGKTQAQEIQNLILKINEEIKNSAPDLKQIIQPYIHLILLQANRSYEQQNLQTPLAEKSNHTLLNAYRKLVSQHFISKRKVSDYADLMHITSNHLNKVIKHETGKTAHDLIEEMLLLEAKALVKHTEKSIAEIAYQLDFSDPSHFNKFFKKLNGTTPLKYRAF
ncbi:MAG TPA: helix-turn-helix domain-containing protein [Chitinophagales bacterium]|nr:helix-turn-helix domain-containing protein [Chitinophagales bacterium]